MRDYHSRAGSAGSPAGTLKETSNLMSRIRRGGLIAFLFLGFVASASASDLTGMASVGVRGGGALFLSGLDPERFRADRFGNAILNAVGDTIWLDQKVSPRLAGDLVFGYAWSDNITLELNTGWAWSRITTGSKALQDSFFVVTSVPFVLSARYLMRDGKTWRPYLGAGGGLYWVSILSRDLGPAKDPQTFERLRKAVPGFFGTVGVEKRFTKLVTGTADLAYHHAFSEDRESFPKGFSGSKSYLQARLGFFFHFDVSERIETGFPE
jgi:outer membrane protein W